MCLAQQLWFDRKQPYIPKRALESIKRFFDINQPSHGEVSPEITNVEFQLANTLKVLI